MRSVDLRLHRHYYLVKVADEAIRISNFGKVLHILVMDQLVPQVSEDLVQGVGEPTFKSSLLSVTRQQDLVQLDEEVFVVLQV